jgi:tellurite resistance-related uncharacterized protein
MENLPPDVEAYRRTPSFTEHTVPQALLTDHRTKAGVWARIVVETGALLMRIAETGEQVHLEPGVDGVAAPEQAHRVELSSTAKFFVEFHR